jgi:hypothetical protein
MFVICYSFFGRITHYNDEKDLVVAKLQDVLFYGKPIREAANKVSRKIVGLIIGNLGT